MEINWLQVLNSGGGIALAVFAITMLDRTYKGWLADKETQVKEMEQQRQTLIEVVKENTQAFTDQSQALRELTQAICQERRVRVKPKASSAE